MGSNPALYVEVFSDPIYLNTVVNTLIFLAFGVNVKLFLALLLSGFFMRPGWWTKALLLVFVLPWAIPALPTFISIHWMLNGEWGLINNFLWIVFGVDGPSWLNSRWFALGSAVFSHVWKWTPFWTVILLAGRMSIPQEIYDAAKVDGATGLKRFLYVTFPLLANLYLVLTLLATIFLLGDFNSVYFVTGGGPANSTHLLATLGVVRDMLELGKPQLGVAVVMSALPLLIPLVIILMRKLRTAEVQL
jgi:multiple sugar transport system permease protein